MKKTIYSLLILVIAGFMFSSCSKDDDNSSDFSSNDFCGTWTITNIKVGDTWYDTTQYPYTKFSASASFYKDGKYFGTGYFGTGNGTYKVSGNTIKTYIDGDLYATYHIKSLTSSFADIIMAMDNDSMEIKARKS